MTKSAYKSLLWLTPQLSPPATSYNTLSKLSTCCIIYQKQAQTTLLLINRTIKKNSLATLPKLLFPLQIIFIYYAILAIS